MFSSTVGEIYVVDDDEDDQFLIQQVLGQYYPAGSIRILADGEVLLRTLEQATVLPRLILLDINMPRLGGLEVLRIIRTNPAYIDLKIVILTTSDSEWDRQQATDLQADDYFVKPSTIEQMNQLMIKLKQQWLMASDHFNERRSK